MPSDPSSADPAADRALAAVRRVDWRFLLPRPELGRVRIVGRADAGLRDALEAIPGTLVLSGGDAAADLTVATRPSSQDRPALSRAVAPGAWAVVEAGRAAGSLVRRLRAEGLVDATAHVAWPRHGRTTAYAPLDGDGALRLLLRRQLAAPVASLAGAPALRGLVASLLPSVVVVARRPGGQDGAPEPWLRARLRAAAGGASMAPPKEVLLLTPRYRASAHVVALGLDEAGAVSVVGKAARLPGGAASLEREADALRRLEASNELVLAPRVLAVELEGAAPLLVESAIDGRPLDPAAVRHDRSAAAGLVEAYVRSLPVAAEPVAGAIGRLLDPALERLGRALRGTGDEVLVGATATALAPVRDHALPAPFEHGDLAHPNLLVTRDGRLAAVDWERAQPEGLPLHDLVVALAYAAGAAAGARTADAQAAAFVDAVAGRDPWLAPTLDRELHRLGIDPTLRPALVLLPWVRTAAWLAERTEPSWLRQDRSLALWRAILRGMHPTATSD